MKVEPIWLILEQHASNLSIYASEILHLLWVCRYATVLVFQ